MIISPAISARPKDAKGPQPTVAKRSSPTSVLVALIVALVVVQPAWGALVMASSWAAWLGCSLVLWEGTKGAVLPRVGPHASVAQVFLMLATFVVLRAVFGWYTPLAQLSRWYWSAVLLPSVDTFVGLETISGLVQFAGAPKRGLFPVPLG
jgi:hypothetical protein